MTLIDALRLDLRLDPDAAPMTAEEAVGWAKPSVGRCDDCGRFTGEGFDVWVTAPTPSIDRTVCRRCAIRLGIATGGVR